jgi:hypothetical protein
MIAGKAVLLLVVGTAIGLCVYLNYNKDAYSGSEVEPLPGKDSRMNPGHGAGDSGAAVDLDFSGRGP